VLEHLLACSCGEVLVKSTNGTTKVRGKILLFRDGQGYVVCKGCGEERAVPVRMDEAAATVPRAPRLYVTGDRK